MITAPSESVQAQQDSVATFPIDIGTTSAPVEQENKYHYPEFAGFAGERYLLSLAQQIAPLALWRTWWATVSFQAPGHLCYVGVGKIVTRVGPQERKIYLDLAALEERGWLVQSRARMPFVQEDDTVIYAPVTVKDFNGFYATAHDYHLWKHEAGYIAPERENIPLILADPELTKRLLKFENYRRLLVCGKPGPKTSTDQADYHVRQFAKVQQRQQERHEPKVNQYFNGPANPDSPYRKDSQDQDFRKEAASNDSIAQEGVVEVVEPQAIRNLNEASQTENASQQPRIPIESKANPPSPQKEKGAGAAKRVEADISYTEEELKRDSAKRGAAVVGIPADQLEKLRGGLDAAEQQAQARTQARREAEERGQRQRHPMPPKFRERITSLVQSYDEPHLIKSDVSRAWKLYMTAWQALVHIETQQQFETMYWQLFDQAAVKAATFANERTNSRGQTNIVPYFFTCFENSFELTLEELAFLRTPNPLYADSSLWDTVDYLRNTYKEQYADGTTKVDYTEWLQLLLDELEHCKQPKTRPNRTQREE